MRLSAVSDCTQPQNSLDTLQTRFGLSLYVTIIMIIMIVIMIIRDFFLNGAGAKDLF